MLGQSTSLPGRLILTLAAAFFPLHAQTSAASTPEFFETKIRPVLANNCYNCHGSSALGGLRLDTRDFMLKGGKSGPSIVPGDADNSLLNKAIRQTGSTLKMPQGGKLKDPEIEDIVAWVKAGAQWPKSATPTSAGQTDGKYVISPERRAFWSIQPLKDPALPASERYALAPQQHRPLRAG